MTLQDRVKRAIAKRLFGFGPVDDVSYVDKFTGPAKDIKLLGMYSGITYACINAIAEEIGRYTPYLYTLNADNTEITIAKHPFLEVLENPNPDLSKYQLFEGSASFIEQFGEFFWYMVPGAISGYGATGPKEIYLLRPDKMGMTVDKQTGDVLGYTYNSGTGNNNILFTPEEIIHHMTFNPKNPYRGYSTVEAAIDYIQTEEEVSKFTRNYFHNNAAMSGILNVNGKLEREQWDKFVRQWRERYQGVDNAGKVALIRDSQIDFTPISSDIGSMQLTDLKETTIEQILMMFRIPKGIFGMESEVGLGRASVETLEYIFAKRTIDPKLCRFDDTLQRCIDRYFPNSGLKVGHENIIPADKEFELSVYNQGVDRWLTREDIRNKDPELANVKIEGADQLFVSTTMLPINDAMTSDLASRKPPVIMPTNPETPADEDQEDDDNDVDGNDDGGDDTSASAIKPDVIKITKKKDNSLNKEQYVADIASINSKYTKQYKEELIKLLHKQETRVLGNINHLAGKKTIKGLADDFIDPANEQDDFVDGLDPTVTDVAIAAGGLANTFTNAGVPYAISNSLKQALKASIAKMASNFNDQTIEMLNQTLAEGIQAGEGIDQLSNRVAEVYDQATSYRTDRVARTETINASSQASLDSYQQNPAVVSIEWQADSDPCPFCADLDGTVIGTEEVFVNQGDSVDVGEGDDAQSYVADYGDVGAPPLHPNCECTILPVTN